MVHAGSLEILRDDASRLGTLASAANVPVSIEVYDGMPHLFQAHLTRRKPLSSLNRLGQFIRLRTHSRVPIRSICRRSEAQTRRAKTYAPGYAASALDRSRSVVAGFVENRFHGRVQRQLDALQDGAAEIGGAQFRPRQIGISEIGLGQHGLAQIRAAKISVARIGAFDACRQQPLVRDQQRTEIHVAHIGLRQLGAFEIDAAQIGACELGAS